MPQPAQRSAIRLGLAMLYLAHEARRVERLIEACSGDVEQAERVYREIRRAETVGLLRRGVIA